MVKIVFIAPSLSSFWLQFCKSASFINPPFPALRYDADPHPTPSAPAGVKITSGDTEGDKEKLISIIDCDFFCYTPPDSWMRIETQRPINHSTRDCCLETIHSWHIPVMMLNWLDKDEGTRKIQYFSCSLEPKTITAAHACTEQKSLQVNVGQCPGLSIHTQGMML